MGSTVPDRPTPAPRRCFGASVECTISQVVFRLGKMLATPSKLPLHHPTSDSALGSNTNFQNPCSSLQSLPLEIRYADIARRQTRTSGAPSPSSTSRPRRLERCAQLIGEVP